MLSDFSALAEPQIRFLKRKYEIKYRHTDNINPTAQTANIMSPIAICLGFAVRSIFVVSIGAAVAAGFA